MQISYPNLLLSPSLAHLNRLLPPRESLILLRSLDLRCESSYTGGIYILQLIECFPDADGETGSDGGT
jgi:hypothetical protein